LSFYQELKDRLDAPGDFAQAYVIAHEVGHHVQELLGIADQAHAAMAGASEDDASALSVRMELQADRISGFSWVVSLHFRLLSQYLPHIFPQQ
jgi:predicted metalloprotease